MGRSSAMVRLAFIFIVVSLVAVLTSCSSSSPTTNTTFPVPANITLTPANTVSLDVGSATQIFTATPQNSKHVTITTPVSFLSSNTAVLTISSSGLACAGTWDSITTPQICTPGPVGVALVTATSHGVSSPPTTVYVHQHIDSIVVSPVPAQTPPTGPCFSKGQTFNYQATALSRGLDVTATRRSLRLAVNRSPGSHTVGAYRDHARGRPGDRTGTSDREHAGHHFAVCQ